MFTILLCILFSTTLSITDLTCATLISWFNQHPIFAIIAIIDLICGSVLSANLLTIIILAIKNEDNCCCGHEHFEEDVERS